MGFTQTLQQIRSLKIQGAEHVALAAAYALLDLVQRFRTHSPASFSRELLSAQRKLLVVRSTEPALRNVLTYVLEGFSFSRRDSTQMRFLIVKRVRSVEQHFLSSQRRIADLIEKKVPLQGIVFTHCHSSTVVAGLIAARKKGKRFVVYNTEARPLYQGRITAKELARHNIPVYHFVDSAARVALKKADLVLLGSDAVTTTKVYNKIGSELIAEVAHRYQIPVYVCTNSWKFDPRFALGDEEEIEERSWKEVWSGKPKGVTIMNPAFEAIAPELVTGIISELGVMSHALFVSELMKKGIRVFEK